MEQARCFYRISSKALILNEQKKFLLLKETNGLREFPGGGLEFWETPQEGLERELKEEMGIKAKEIQDQPAYFLTAKNLKGIWIANVLYQTEIDFESLKNFKASEECVELRFFNREEAEKEQLFPNVQAFLKCFNPANH